METDRELLMWAAKAVGITGTFSDEGLCYFKDYGLGRKVNTLWNPLTSDGDRYRLLSKLKAHIDFESQISE